MTCIARTRRQIDDLQVENGSHVSDPDMTN
jgi:hypothetical protein